MITRRDKPTKDEPIPEAQPGWIKTVLDQQEFTSIDEVNAFLGKVQTSHNSEPREKFQGLSPELMHKLLTKPFDSPEVAVFHSPPPAVADTPFMRLFLMLTDALRDNGLRATAKGNLPRNFCREAAKAYWGEEEYAVATRYCGINNETDFMPIRVVRHVAECAEMIRLNGSRWSLTESGQTLLDTEGLVGAFFPLFRTFTQRFNWGEQDGYPEALILQGSFLFTLALLAKHGGEWRVDSFYADQFLSAFPTVIDREFGSSHFHIYDDRAQPFRLCYSVRILERFAAFWGLTEAEEVSEEEADYQMSAGRRVRRLPLLVDLVTFPWLD